MSNEKTGNANELPGGRLCDETLRYLQSMMRDKMFTLEKRGFPINKIFFFNS